jgi:hypothetical protein
MQCNQPKEACFWDQLKRTLGMYMMLPGHALVENMHLIQALA